MDDPRLMSMNNKINKYFALVKLENPNMSERDALEQAATLALTEQKEFEAKAQLDVNDVSVADRFGDGTRITTAEDDSKIVRVDHAWQQSKGSKISSDGFYKKGYATITMPKEIDITTSEGDRKAGKFVEELKDAKNREKKMKHEMEKQQWEDRTIQVTVDKEIT